MLFFIIVRILLLQYPVPKAPASSFLLEFSAALLVSNTLHVCDCWLPGIFHSTSFKNLFPTPSRIWLPCKHCKSPAAHQFFFSVSCSKESKDSNSPESMCGLLLLAGRGLPAPFCALRVSLLLVPVVCGPCFVLCVPFLPGHLLVISFLAMKFRFICLKKKKN